MTRGHRHLAVFFTAFAPLAAVGPAMAQDEITRVSVDSGGVEGNQDSGYDYYLRDAAISSISQDGRHVAFASRATNLVAGDSNGSWDVFVHDRESGATVRVSVDSSGLEGDGDSFWPSLSQDGRFVAFESSASNLVAGDTNRVEDVFVHDRDPDGNGVFDEGNGVTTLISVRSDGRRGDGNSFEPSISGDGTLVAFASDANDLIASDANGRTDVFVRDRSAGTTRRVSVDSAGLEAAGTSFQPAISADGQSVAFESDAANLVANDTNLAFDIFVRDRVNKLTTRVSVDSSGGEAEIWGNSHHPSISADGASVAFESYAGNLVAGDSNYREDVFVHDRATGVTTRVSVDSLGGQGGDSSFQPSLSADGQVVAFGSWAANLVPNDTNSTSDVFVHDRATGVTTSLDFNCAGVIADGASLPGSVSGDGRLVGFSSGADNLISGDTNYAYDLFVFDRSVVEPDASWSDYDAGFAGTNGIPTLTASADPVLGTTISIDVGNSLGTWTTGFVFFGWNRASLLTRNGGTILVDWSLILPIALWPAGSSLPADIPLDPALCGVSAFLQAIEIDGGAQYGLSFTPGLELRMGH